MITNQLLSFLEKGFEKSSYEIWVQKPHDTSFQLLHKKGKLKNENINLLKLNFDDTYTTFTDEENLYISFSYLNGHQVLLRSNCITSPFDKRDLDYLSICFELLDAKSQIQAKDAELDILIEGIRSVSSSLVLDDLLEKIVKNALSVIPVANAGYLQLYDPSEKVIITKTSVGFEPIIGKLRMNVGESITGMVFKEGKPLIYHSTDQIYKKMSDHSISPENLQIINSSSKGKVIQAIVSVPISIGDQRIGVMTIHQFDKKGRFTEGDVRLLQGFASQVAIAIQNARLYTEVNEKLQELSKRNEVHNTLIKFSLQNKGLETIVKEIGKMINRKVSFYDYLENDWYHNQVHQKSDFSVDEISRIFKNRRHAVFVEIRKPKEEKYYLYPIINGTIFLGCFILPYSTTLSIIDRIVIEQGGAILALELVKKHTLEEIYYKKTHEFFNEVIKSREPEALIAKRKEFNLIPSHSFFVVVIELVNYKDLYKLGADIHSIISLIKKNILHVRLIYGFHNKIILLVSLADSSLVDDLIKRLKTIIQNWTNNNDSFVCVGIGSTKKGAYHIGKSYEEAKKSVAYLVNKKETGIIIYESIGVNRLFINQDTNEIEEFINGFFQPLNTTRSRKNDLELTLLTYIKLNKSINETAKSLHIHINTLYQRLKKIEEILHLDFNDPKDFLKIQLACHLKESFAYSDEVH
ncbi:GAF domain-containing protein [Bacillus sp. HNG]|uniref:helix-turn-helix domain-containing protein n=1 Tax=Bacillus sp. HNG TaxID=2293325 RepID=UPI000E2F0700|nr:helix-turn-helix domain-containing protein [Bacillus sp. HNG]RFB18118.1 GAF domain-containing protein [Bacillus sp. HNG]